MPAIVAATRRDLEVRKAGTSRAVLEARAQELPVPHGRAVAGKLQAFSDNAFGPTPREPDESDRLARCCTGRPGDAGDGDDPLHR